MRRVTTQWLISLQSVIILQQQNPLSRISTLLLCRHVYGLPPKSFGWLTLFGLTKEKLGIVQVLSLCLMYLCSDANPENRECRQLATMTQTEWIILSCNNWGKRCLPRGRTWDSQAWRLEPPRHKHKAAHRRPRTPSSCEIGTLSPCWSSNLWKQ